MISSIVKLHKTCALLLLVAGLFGAPCIYADAPVQQEPVQTSEATASQEDIGRLIPIWDVTMNAPLDFPPCVGLSFKSAAGGSCMTVSDPQNVQTLPFFKYVTSIGAIWYNTYDPVRSVPPLLVFDSPTVGLDDQNRVVYLMTYPRADEASQEEVFAMLKELFGEPEILVVQHDVWAQTPFREISNEWYGAKQGSRIAFWNTEEVWVRYVFERKSGYQGILVIGLKRILEEGSIIPPIFNY